MTLIIIPIHCQGRVSMFCANMKNEKIQFILQTKYNWTGYLISFANKIANS